MTDLVAMQAEQIAWSEKNFGQQSYRNPLLGMIEEICEFDQAWRDWVAHVVDGIRIVRAKQADEWARLKESNPDASEPVREEPTVDLAYKAAVVDAIGDIAIYMLDYCGKRGWQLKTFWDVRNCRNEQQCNDWDNLVPHAGKLAHHDLKSAQGIRGKQEVHDQEIMMTLCAILAHLEFISRYINEDFLAILDAVWAKVSKRDWTNNKTNAHEVAEQQVIDMTRAAGSTDP